MPLAEIYQANKEHYRAKQREFYHRRGKYLRKYYEEKIKNNPRVKELRKAARKRHYYKQHGLIAYFKNKPCADCQGWFNPYQMHFDHRNPAEKLFTIGDRVTRARKALLLEIKKCDVVCANCHAERTHKLMESRKFPHKPFSKQDAWL